MKLILFAVILFFLISYLMTTTSAPSSSYSEVIVDPKTLKPVKICSKRGRELMRRYMACYFEEYLQKTSKDWNYILPSELHNMNLKKYFLLDVRKPEDYHKGHIPGSINIFWLDLMKKENISKLPKDQKIIVICYVGHTASQILVLLKLLGYNVQVLKFGMGISPKKEVPIAGWTTYGYQVES